MHSFQYSISANIQHLLTPLTIFNVNVNANASFSEFNANIFHKVKFSQKCDRNFLCETFQAASTIIPHLTQRKQNAMNESVVRFDNDTIVRCFFSHFLYSVCIKAKEEDGRKNYHKELSLHVDKSLFEVLSQ